MPPTPEFCPGTMPLWRPNESDLCQTTENLNSKPRGKNSPQPPPILDCFEFQERPGQGSPSPPRPPPPPRHAPLLFFEVQILRNANRRLAGCQRIQLRTEGASYWESAVSRTEIRHLGETAVKFTAELPSSWVHIIRRYVYPCHPTWVFPPTVAF